MSVLRDVALLCLSACAFTEVTVIEKQKKANEFSCKFCRCSSYEKKWARNGGKVRCLIVSGFCPSSFLEICPCGRVHNLPNIICVVCLCLFLLLSF